MLDFVAVGDVMLDVHLPDAAGARSHGTIATATGGSAVNAARAAACLGASAAVVGAIGDDPVGRVIELELEASGIEAHLERVVGTSTGVVVYGTGSVVADRGANAGFTPEHLPEARVTLVSAYLPAAARAAALELAHGLRAVDLQGLLADAPGADVVLGPHLDVAALAARHAVVCSTLAADGAEAARGEERARVRPPRVLDESPVGAGDRFAAGFLLALADGLELEECLQRGCGSALEDA
jgi:sugar/nucleoside kinase (ribokinase family)